MEWLCEVECKKVNQFENMQVTHQFPRTPSLLGKESEVACCREWNLQDALRFVFFCIFCFLYFPWNWPCARFGLIFWNFWQLVWNAFQFIQSCAKWQIGFCIKHKHRWDVGGGGEGSICNIKWYKKHWIRPQKNTLNETKKHTENSVGDPNEHKMRVFYK